MRGVPAVRFIAIRCREALYIFDIRLALLGRVELTAKPGFKAVGIGIAARE